MACNSGEKINYTYDKTGRVTGVSGTTFAGGGQYLSGVQYRAWGAAVSPLVHSDRGSQYASAAFRARLTAWGCLQSMSRTGNCWDNAVTESFFGVLKAEMIHHERFATRQEAKDKLFDYIEVFYNRMRIHSATDYFAPADYEAR